MQSLLIRMEQMAALGREASRIRRNALADRVHQDIERRNPELFRKYGRELLLRRIVAALEFAENKGYSSEAALSLFALLTLRFGPGFWERPRVRAALEAVKDLDDSLLALVANGHRDCWYTTGQEAIEAQWAVLFGEVREESRCEPESPEPVEADDWL